MSTINRYADYLPVNIPEYFNRIPQDRTPIRPLLAGETLPSFHIHKKHIITAADILKSVNGSLPVTQLLDRPLVLVFHSASWNDYGKKLVQELEDIYANIRVMGGQLLVATAEEREYFEQAVEKNRPPFAVIWDQHHHIARKAGIYSPSDPIWNRVSGINADVPVPALFVLTPALRIAYSATDEWFDRPFNKRELLSAVYDASREEERGIAI